MIELILASRHLKLGASFEVDRVLPSKRRTIGPFVLLDHGGPVEHSPGEGFAVLPHPVSRRSPMSSPASSSTATALATPRPSDRAR